jgi:hypothetical protein
MHVHSFGIFIFVHVCVRIYTFKNLRLSTAKYSRAPLIRTLVIRMGLACKGEFVKLALKLPVIGPGTVKCYGFSPFFTGHEGP